MSRPQLPARVHLFLKRMWLLPVPTYNLVYTRYGGVYLIFEFELWTEKETLIRFVVVVVLIFLKN